MKTTHAGHLAVLKVEQRAIELGWTPSRPSVDAPYDLVLDDGSRLYRVQVKYGNGSSSHAEGAVIVNLRKRANGSKARSETYNRADVDLIMAYLPKCDAIVKFEPAHFEGKPVIQIRIAPSKARQTKINRLEDFRW